MIRPTTIISAPRLNTRLGANVLIASESFQTTGSFKFRAAYNLASNVAETLLITASSGNFGQALACACSLLSKKCIVVMPETSAQVKIEAVKAFGGQVELVDVNSKSREQRVSELAAQYPEAYVASAYDDALVIAGNASLGRELAALDADFDTVIVPIGGGGLSAGVILGLRESGRQVGVVGAEPLMGDDAARSLKAGELIRNESEPQTIADGARTVSLGALNWAVIKDGIADIVQVPEDCICEGVRLLFSLANLKAEPTGALSIGALLATPERFRGRSVCCVVSGGNVDPAVYAKLISG
jgi:threonine dehydratase